MSSRDQSGRSLYIGNRIAVVVVALGVLTLLGFGVLAWRPAIAPATRLAILLKADRASLAVMQCRPLLG